MNSEKQSVIGFTGLFVVEDAQRKEVTFHFDENRLGYWGPAVSYDLENWHWLGECDENSFTYRFAPSENEVYFAHHILYHPKRFHSFAQAKGFEVSELCKIKLGKCFAKSVIKYIEFS